MEKNIKNFIIQSLGIKDFFLSKIQGGGNNSIFTINYENKAEYILKKYFNNRNRIIHDTKFTLYLWHIGVRNIPQLIKYDELLNLGIFKYINGDSYNIHNISKLSILDASSFIQKINYNKLEALKHNIPNAAESSFTFEKHIEIITERVNIINNINENSEYNFINNNLKLLKKEINFLWKKINLKITKIIKKKNIYNLLLPIEERILSPSDFGFHNTLIEKTTKKLFFYDFEYSGWDDPAKLMCDFSNQPDVQINDDLSNLFNEEIIKLSNNPENLIIRYNLLLPALQLKWVCIILNIFRKIGKERIMHINDEVISEEKILENQKLQIKKAFTMIEKVKKSFNLIN